jgi:N-acetylmuramoyl-L-alanine amidase
MRDIKYIVVHCTATQPDTKIESIQRFWQEQLGWKNPGYHYIIKRNGDVVRLQPDNLIANGVAGNNRNAIHISYIGGVDKENKPIDNRTDAQKHALFSKLVALSEKYTNAIIKGHRDFPGVTKACPSFDVREWLQHYIPDLDIAA